MFKVVESGDGFTNIFCKETGNLICTVRGNNKVGVGCRIPRPFSVESPRKNSPVQKVAPRIREVKPSICILSPIKDEDASNSISSDVFDEVKVSIPEIPEVEVTEDYFDDCINQDEFLRCMGLIPSKTILNDEVKNLQKTFSTRWISRSRPEQISQPLPDIKICDDADLCSPLGEKLLKSNSTKNFVNESTATMSIKKYDSYCRFALSSANLTGCNFPKLRCREMKLYPLTYRPQKSLKFSNCHMYSFNKRERLERLKVIRTGLTKKSRQLRALCSSKRIAVILKRLSANEIKTWTARKPRPTLVVDLISPPRGSSRSSSPEIEILSVINKSSKVEVQHSNDKSSQIVKQTPFIHPVFAASSSKSTISIKSNTEDVKKRPILRRYTGIMGRLNMSLEGKSNGDCSSSQRDLIFFMSKLKCTVRLRNVVDIIRQNKNNYFVMGTKIRVSNFELIAGKHRGQSIKHGRKFDSKCVLHNSAHSDHAYHKSVLKEYISTDDKSLSVSSASKKTPRIIQSKNNDTSTKAILVYKTPQESNSILSSSWRQKSLLKNNLKAPIIDLTLDESELKNGLKSPKIGVVSERYSVSSWMFRCFGCGHSCKFPKKAIADDQVMQHMLHFHSVSQPELFLSSYLDTVNHTAIIEAFPGYKRNYAD